MKTWEESYALLASIKKEVGLDKAPEPEEAPRPLPGGSYAASNPSRPRRGRSDIGGVSGYEANKPLAGEIPLKRFVQDEMQKTGKSYGVIYAKIGRGEYPITLRRVNGRVVYVKKVEAPEATK